MITLIHGDDYISSRNYIYEEKKENNSSMFLEGKNLDLAKLNQIINSNNLFFDKPILFIENFFSGKKENELKKTTDFLQKISSEINIIFWEDKEISKKNLNIFKNAKIILFKYPSSIFVFLDTITPRNGKSSIVLYHQVLKYSSPEQIIYMLIRQFRLLLAIKNFNDSDSIDEIKKLSAWQKLKLEKQSRLFTNGSLTKIYNQLFQLDYQSKTGMLRKPISQAIDFLLLDI